MSSNEPSAQVDSTNTEEPAPPPPADELKCETALQRETIGIAIKQIVKELDQSPLNSHTTSQIYKSPSTSTSMETEMKEGVRRYFLDLSKARSVGQTVRGPDLIKQFESVPSQPPLPRDCLQREADIQRRVKEYLGGIGDEEFNDLTAEMDVDPGNKLYRFTDEHNLLDKSRVKHYSIFPEDSTLVSHRVLSNTMAMQDRVQICHYLKYRGDRVAISRSFNWMQAEGEDDMIPGKTVLYHVRFYRPYKAIPAGNKSRLPKRMLQPSLLAQREYVFHGRQTLSELRDLVKCGHDYGPRTDISEAPNEDYIELLQEVFPSGVLFINNIFYNDTRNPKSKDYSENIRKWSKDMGIAELEKRDMEGVTLDSLEIRLGHPELYIHQGDCEHLFSFSHIRLLSPSDICVSSHYPLNISKTMHKSTYCFICGFYISQWVVCECPLLPLDPAYLCKGCFKQYLYKDGVKMCEFKAFKYYDRNM